MSKKRQFIVPEMYDLIFESYDSYYSKTGEFKDIDEVGEFLNKEFYEINLIDDNLTESAYRKYYNRMIDGFNEGMRDSSTDKQARRTAVSLNKLKKTSVIVSAQRSEVNKDLKKVSLHNYISNEILTAYNNYEYKDFKMSKIDVKNNEEYALYCWADFHYGVIVSVENKQRKTKNIFTDKIARKAFGMFISYVIEDVNKNGYKKFGIAGLGDDIEGGSLRASQLFSISKTMTEQTLECADIYVQGIDLILSSINDDVKFDLFFVNSSNHSQLRLHHSKRDEMPNDDFGLIIANQLLSAFRDEDKINVITNDVIVANILGKKIAILHGQQYSLAKMFESISKQCDGVDYVLVGHYHSYSVQGHYSKGEYVQQLIKVPSLIGDTDHSNRLGYSERPQALKLLFDKKYGITQYQLIQVR